MALKSPTSGLRRIHHSSRSFDKVNLSIAPDEVLYVSDSVADQLVAASSQFKDAVPEEAPPTKRAVKPPKKTTAKKA